MSTQQDIYTAGSKSRPPMLNKENYVPWSSRLLRYAKSRPNRKLIHNSIINGPYVRRMIPKPEWSRHVTIVHQTKDLHTADYTQLYDFLKYNQKEVDELKAERLAKIQDPLALMEYSNNPYAFPAPHQDQPSYNQNYMQQLMPNLKEIIDLTTTMNMALVLMAKAFKLNYSTPTNNNQRISSNPGNRQIAHPGNANLNGNGNLVVACAEGNATGQNGNQINGSAELPVRIFMQKTSVVDTSNLQTELEHTKERFETCIIKKENEYAKIWNDWYTKCKECKYDKISYDTSYKDMQQKIERLQAQLGELKGKSKDTSYVSDTLNLLSQKLENENVELEFQDNKHGMNTNTKFAKQSIVENLPKVGKTHALSKPVISNSVPTPQESKVMKNDKVIALGMFRINSFKTFREENHVPNTVRASARTTPITVSQPPVITKKYVNSNSNDLEVAFRRNAYFVRNIGVDLLKGERSTNLYTINLHEMASTSLICLMARASSTKSWLWHQRINGKRHVLVIVDDYSRYTWVYFLRSKDKVPEVIKTFLKRITVLLQSPVIIIRTGNDTEFKIKALCYPKNDREDIGKLGAKGDIGFFIGYSVDSCAYRVYNRRTKKIMETMNISFDDLLAMAFEQRRSKPGLQNELDLLFEAMYDDYIGGQPSATARSVTAAQAQQVRQTSMTSTSIADTARTPTNSSSQATNFPNSSPNVDELNSQQQHAQQQGNQAHLQSITVAENVPNALFDGNTFVNPFAIPSTSAVESSS
nr:integrase, catalytic region, zinc finger, CCHC-type, peptidase aspartic, catalytic [Tanacetum cinerariifolium]